MSLFVAVPLATFLFFSGFAAAQVFAPVCFASYRASLGWTVNSLNQNPCLVAAYMEATCFDGSFILPALGPGYTYMGPDGGSGDLDLCACNTVMYSLLSACGACQGAKWISWSEFSSNCTTTLPPSSFPNPVPSGTRVPLWALMDVTSENMWDLKKALAVGGTPEKGPGAILGSSGAATSLSGTKYYSTTSSASSLFFSFSEPSLTVTPSSTVTPTSLTSPLSNSSSNMGVIVGASVGAVAAIPLVIVIGFFL